MARLTGPLLSIRAKGQVGQTLVFGAWRGTQYARQYVSPSNPKTAAQQETRNTFKTLSSIFKIMPPLATAPWVAYTKGLPLTDRNAFFKFNISPLRNQANMNPLILTPGALGGLPPASATGTPAAGQITVAVTAPATLPVGWTIQAAVAAAIRDGDPQTTTFFTTIAGEDVSTPYSIVLTGLAAGTYQWRAWLRWLRPDLLIAYSTAVGGTAVVT